MKPSALLQRLGFWTVWGTVLLLPTFFLPLTSEYYEFNKQALLVVSSFVLLALWAATFISDRQVRLVRSPLGLPILAIVAAWLLSTLLRSPNRIDAFLEPGQTATWVGLALFFFTATNFVKTKQELEWLSSTIIISICALGLISLAWAASLGPRLVPWEFMKSNTWTPGGAPLSTITLLVTLVPYLLVLILKDKVVSTKTYLLAAALFVNITAAALLGYRLLNPPAGGSRPMFLPFSVSWAVALETLKVSPLWGTGPGTFFYNFTQFRPVSYNLTPNWALRFVSASSQYLQIISTIGAIGLAAYFFLVFRVWRLAARAVKTAGNSAAPHAHVLAVAGCAAALFSFAWQLVLPISFPALTLTLVLLVIAVVAMKQTGSSSVHEANIDIVAASSTGEHTPILPWIAAVLAIALTVPGLYLGGRAYLADIYYQNALAAARANQAKQTYDNLILAIQTNPYRDVYRSVYAQTNILIANGIASRTDLADSDRQTIVQLVQQAIREAKNAVVLNPRNVNNLENLANVYRNLLNFAQGADAWTVASYRQAIVLDPVNPNLRIALGGVFFAQKNYDEASKYFQQAIDLKPDLANAHYNLAAAYREKGDFARAFSAMQNVVQLVNRESPDYQTASRELEELRQKAGSTATPTAAPGQTSELTAPQPLPTPKVNPPIQLNESFSPEAPSTPSSNPETNP